MLLCYELSNAQRKELQVRGRAVLIAIPAPPHPIRDVLDWARSVLPSDLRQYVRLATERTITVAPLQRDNHGVSALLGPINSTADWLVSIPIIEVELAPPNRRGSPLHLQWPGSLYVKGMRFPKPFVSRPGEVAEPKSATPQPGDTIDFEALAAERKTEIYRESQAIRPGDGQPLTPSQQLLHERIAAKAPQASPPQPDVPPPARAYATPPKAFATPPDKPMAGSRGQSAGNYAWTPPADLVARMGKEPANQLAKAFGVSEDALAKAMHRLGIKPFALGHTWTPAEDAMLGTDTDQAIADRLGLSRDQVKDRRTDLGVEPSRKKLPWTPERIALLAGEPDDRKAAELLGLSVKGVQTARSRYLRPSKD